MCVNASVLGTSVLITAPLVLHVQSLAVVPILQNHEPVYVKCLTRLFY